MGESRRCLRLWYPLDAVIRKNLRLFAAGALTLSASAGALGEPDRPPGFSAHTKQLLRLYEELHSFKDDPGFHEVGFGRCCRFHGWLARVEALRSKAGAEMIGEIGVLPADLIMLGREYLRSRGTPTEYTETMTPYYRSGLDALARRRARPGE